MDGTIDRSRVKLVTFGRLMNDFDNLMFEILDFTDIEKTDALREEIIETSEKQKQFKSGHAYDLERFGLTEDQVREDCKVIYETFLQPKTVEKSKIEKDKAVA